MAKKPYCRKQHTCTLFGMAIAIAFQGLILCVSNAWSRESKAPHGLSRARALKAAELNDREDLVHQKISSLIYSSIEDLVEIDSLKPSFAEDNTIKLVSDAFSSQPQKG